MKKKLHLTDPKFLPEITEADNAFAKDVIKKVGEISFDALVWLIRDIRSTLEDSEFYEYLDENYEKKYFQKFQLKENDPLFHIINKQLKKIRTEIKEQKSRDKKYIEKRILLQSVFFKLIAYFSQTNLNQYDKHVVIGMFLVHFKLWPYTKPYQNESEFNNNPSTAAETWAEYLFNITKTRLKKYSSQITL